ncbi:hypothetical protein Tco_0941348 [Tanacetum coccineum]|uniref:Uncharacterized protein n=1 Tax=Tanacetum coccineum TaxID=301880 RepID=A0ABQ5DRH1_9ASTR
MARFLFHLIRPPDHCSKGESILTYLHKISDYMTTSLKVAVIGVGVTQLTAARELRRRVATAWAAGVGGVGGNGEGGRSGGMGDRSGGVGGGRCDV